MIGVGFARLFERVLDGEDKQRMPAGWALAIDHDGLGIPLTEAVREITPRPIKAAGALHRAVVPKIEARCDNAEGPLKKIRHGTPP
jgi:folate-dependent tRNA-U54 methylase TrmFO/GidA